MSNQSGALFHQHPGIPCRFPKELFAMLSAMPCSPPPWQKEAFDSGPIDHHPRTPQ